MMGTRFQRYVAAFIIAFGLYMFSSAWLIGRQGEQITELERRRGEQRVEVIARYMSGRTVEVTGRPVPATGGGLIIPVGFSYDGSGSLALPKWHQDLAEAQGLIPGDKVKLLYDDFPSPTEKKNEPIAFVRCIKM